MLQPVSFICETAMLHGIIHHPASGIVPKRIGIILLNQGPIDRSGFHGISVKLARHLASNGYIVLRFDARAAGESEGEWTEEGENRPYRCLFQEIEKGAWLPDTLSAVKFLIEHCQLDCVILAGICGGAVTALLAGANHPQVAGMTLIGLPTKLANPDIVFRSLPKETIRADMKSYIRKLLEPSAWWRLLSFRTDYKTLIGVISLRLSLVCRTRKSNPIEVIPEDANRIVSEAINSSIKKSKRLLFVFAQKDYLLHDFRELAPPKVVNNLNNYSTFVTIANANHNLTEDVWQHQLSNILDNWLATISLRKAEISIDSPPAEAGL